MEQQQAKYSKPIDILDLSVLSFADEDSKVDVGDKDLRPKLIWKNQGAISSEEEWKIRGELESEIERDLEAEIKDGLYHQALRLHRLYQNRREKINAAKDMSESDHDHNKGDKTLVSEVNITIKMEGGTKIEITETKKEAHPDHRHQKASRSPRRANSVQGRRLEFNGGKKFDWAKSLRAAPTGKLRDHQIKQRQRRVFA